MRRREFILGVGGTATWLVAAHAQQPKMPVIGYLSFRSTQAEVPLLAAYRQGLAALGFIEGGNVEFEFRFADGEYNRLPGLVAGGATPGPSA